jgi:biopolymer transport protein ExbD
MNFGTRQAREEPEINLIPLIDLLLVILIFLMVTTTFSRFTQLQVNLPTAGSDAPSKPTPEIVVAISADGRYEINGRQAPYAGPQAFAQLLQQAAAADPQPALLVLHADAAASHQSVVNVLEAARLAGLPRVTFAAQDSAAAR